MQHCDLPELPRLRHTIVDRFDLEKQPRPENIVVICSPVRFSPAQKPCIIKEAVADCPAFIRLLTT